jgi:hypothetical protein
MKSIIGIAAAFAAALALLAAPGTFATEARTDDTCTCTARPEAAKAEPSSAQPSAPEAPLFTDQG